MTVFPVIDFLRAWQKRSQISYQIDKDLHNFNRIEQVFSQELLTRYRDIKIKNSQKTAIFIVGMPRSGTTLVEQIISSHSEVFGSGELPLLQDLAFNLRFLHCQLPASSYNAIQLCLRQDDIGFGIKERVDVVEINQMAHGVVVGSVIIEQLQNSNEPVNVINDYIRKLTKGT